MSATATWNVIGHADAVHHLQQSIAAGNIGHAYLIAGPEGVGRTTLALEFARALLCLERGDGSACGVCDSCRRVARDAERRSHPDLTVADLDWQAALLGNSAGGQRQRLSIDAIRWLRQDIVTRPVLSRWKVQIVDDADRLSDTAPDAFLKTLEEPPASAVIIMISSRLEAMPETIRSRCRHIQLGLASKPDVVAALQSRGIPDHEAQTIAAIARGRVAQALALSVDPEALDRWREEVAEAFRLVSQPLERLRLAGPIAANHTKDRQRTFALLDHCAALWRDALLVRTGVPDTVTHVEISDSIQDFAKGFSTAEIARALEATHRAAADLDRNFQARIALLAMIERWPAAPDS